MTDAWVYIYKVWSNTYKQKIEEQQPEGEIESQCPMGSKLQAEKSSDTTCYM